MDKRDQTDYPKTGYRTREGDAASDPLDYLRTRVGEFLVSIDVVGLALVGIAGLFRGAFAANDIGGALYLVAAVLAFGGIAFFRR